MKEQQLIDAVKKAKQNLVLFRKIILVNGDKEVNPAAFHFTWSDILLTGNKHVAIEGFRESLPLDTDIPTRNGFKKMRDMFVGDVVYDAEGKEVAVDYVSPIFNHLDCYELSFDDGTKQICSSEHLWYVNDKKKRKFRNVPTAEMASDYLGWEHSNGYREYRFRLPVCGAVKYSKKKLKIDPYVLGYWLGNGDSDHSSFTIGKRDIAEIRAEFSKRGYRLNPLKQDRGLRHSVLGIDCHFKSYGILKNKQIPEDYLLSDTTSRIDLLSGLIDSDGTSAKKGTKKGTITFTSTRPILAKQVLELVRSLGIKATILKKKSWFNGKQYKDHYRICFKPEMLVSKLAFKNNLIGEKNNRSRYKTINKIERVSSIKTRCIGVASDAGLYLITRDYIVTHNSAKDQIVNRAFPLYSIMFPSRDRSYIVIIRNNDTQAAKSIDSISTEALSNPLISARIKKVLKKSANVFSVNVSMPDGEMTITIEGYGKGASIRGLANTDKRPDIIICNDLQDIEDSQSDTVQEKDWEWFLSDVKFLGQYTRIFLIGNNLGERCIIERVFSNPQDSGFETYRIPIADSLITRSSWPEKYTVEAIKQEREQYVGLGKLDIWLRERMCLAVSDETRLVQESDYVYYSPGLADKISDMGNVYATLDPASSSNKESCFRAIVVNCVMPDGHWYILEIPFGRWDSLQLIDKMFEVVSKWGIRQFGIEKGQLQQFVEPFLYKEMTRRNIRFTVIPLEHGKIGSKIQRIGMLQPRFKSKSIWFPDKAYWLDEFKVEMAGVTRNEIKSLYIDLVDALAMQEQMVTVPLSGNTRANERIKNLPRMAVR